MRDKNHLVDHETAIVFKAACKKRLSAIAAESQHTASLLELLALQQQTIGLGLHRLRNLQQRLQGSSTPVNTL